MATSAMLASKLTHLSAFCRNIQRCSKLSIRAIATSSKSKDSGSTTETVVVQPPLPEEKFEKKDWVSYGFDYQSKTDDRVAAHMIWFAGLSLAIIGGCFLVRYYPDYRMHDWAVREAFLELHRREKNGLPLIDEDLIPRDQITLPSDEELGDTEIII